MKQNTHDHSHDAHLALGMIVAYAGGMLIAAIFFIFSSITPPSASSTQAAFGQCPPVNATSQEIAQIENGTLACQ